MIGKRGKLLVLLYMIFLTVLFLMCSTDLIIREPEKEIYQVAVIIEDARDDNYSNFRKGMDQAAVEFNADVRFITLYEKQDADHQMELISREQQDGADALIVAPANEKQVVRAIAEKQVTVPIILLGSGLTGQEPSETIVVDSEKMGEQIGEQMIHDMEEDSLVLMLSDKKTQSLTSRFFLQGAAKVLGNSGHTCQIVTTDSEQDQELFLNLLADMADRPVLILAESPELLTKAAGVLADNPSAGQHIQGLYGRGGTMQILNYLDRGIITGVCVTDEFGIGYFSVRMAIQVLEGLRNQPPMIMESYYIEKEDLREPAYEKMLFPIE